MGPPQVYTITDPDSGEDIDFDWEGAAPPSEADQAAVVQAHRRSKPPTVASTIRGTRIPGAQGLTVGHAEDAVIGAGKGIAGMVTAGGDMIRKAAPWTKALDVDTGGSRENLQPQGTAQNVGSFIGRAALSALPGVRASQGAAALTVGAPLAARVGAQAVAGGATAAGTGKLQGSDSPWRDATIGAVGGAAGPLVGATGRAVGHLARRTVRAAVKPQRTELARRSGASGTELDTLAEESVDTILKHNLATPQAATKVMDILDADLKTLVDKSPATANAADIVMRRLAQVEQWARKNLDDPREMLEAIADKRAGLQSGNLFKDKASVTMGENGVSNVEMSRVPRTDVTPRDLRETAIAGAKTNRTSTKWGGNAGPGGEVAKAVESAERQAVRDMVTDTVQAGPNQGMGAGDVLDEMGRVQTARTMLDRHAVREGSREIVSPFGLGAAAQNTKTGWALFALQQVLRSGQLRSGLIANQAAKAIANQDAQAAATILRNLGVSAAVSGFGRVPPPQAPIEDEGSMTISAPRPGGGR